MDQKWANAVGKKNGANIFPRLRAATNFKFGLKKKKKKNTESMKYNNLKHNRMNSALLNKSVLANFVCSDIRLDIVSLRESVRFFLNEIDIWIYKVKSIALLRWVNLI